MPSVEIVCVGQSEPSSFSAMPMAVEADTCLRSHRWPRPLFQSDFDQLNGCIYHLGSPYLKDSAAEGAFTAADLLTEWWTVLRFKPEFVPHVRQLLEALLAVSPEGRLVFTSDYQFGPPAERFQRPLSLAAFWRRHDDGQLHVNALYHLAE